MPLIEPMLPLYDRCLAELVTQLRQAAGLEDATKAPNEPLHIEATWHEWLTTIFRRYFTDATSRLIPFSSAHEELWAWVWAIERGSRPAPFVGVLPRGGGKSTGVELSCVAVGARKSRKYALYVSGTQEQADDHVQNVATMLESEELTRYYPKLASRMVGKYGTSRGWRRNRVRTAAGFTVDAIGLDTASRGVKLDEDRPDYIVIDDIDQEQDTQATVLKKIAALTRKIIPAGSTDVAIIAVQNLVHGESVFARLLDGRADFLARRQISGPYPAIRGLTYEERDGVVVLTGGEPVWAGQDLARCQAMVDDMGLTAFLAECQHAKEHLWGAMFSEVWDESLHVMPPFRIPATWTIRRAFDWGSSAPFSVGWWAISSGESLPDGRSWPKGTRFRIAEWYGWNGKPNTGLRMLATDIARKILEKEAAMGYPVKPGPADTSIFDRENGVCVAEDMALVGVRWQRGDKTPGSRIQGVERTRELLMASRKKPMDAPGLFVFDTCAQFLRVFPSLPRDRIDPDDVACFVAGTLIDTPNGLVPVEHLRIGDIVHTPIGVRRVLKAGCSGVRPTYRVSCNDRVILEGTYDHKIYVNNRGLLPLCRVSLGDTLLMREELWTFEQLCMQALPSDSILEEDILSVVQQMLYDWAHLSYTEWSGSRRMETFQPDMMSTTKTMIPPKTILKTWNSCLRVIMRDTISKHALQTVGISRKLLRAGARAMKGARVIEQILRSAVRELPSENLRALIVASLLERSIRPKNIARTSAVRRRGVPVLYESSARSVGRSGSLSHIRRNKFKPVVTNVVGNLGSKRVYHLMIEQAHLFYANGILSTNTESEDHIWDETRYEVLHKPMTVTSGKVLGV